MKSSVKLAKYRLEDTAIILLLRSFEVVTSFAWFVNDILVVFKKLTADGSDVDR